MTKLNHSLLIQTELFLTVLLNSCKYIFSTHKHLKTGNILKENGICINLMYIRLDLMEYFYADKVEK